MTTLFGQSELEKLRDLDYTTQSHTFSKGVIAAYYNGMEYPLQVSISHQIKVIIVKRKKDSVHFWLDDREIDKVLPIANLNDTFYSKSKTNLTKVKTKEVVYDLQKIFSTPDKSVRRGINLSKRPEIGARPILLQDREAIEQLYKEWSEHKIADPKVFRISFTPKRYLRSFQLKEKGFNIFDSAYFVNGELYGALCFEVQGDTAFELAFISRYWNKEQKIVNDLNELILINAFHELYLRGIRFINVGPTGGIRGLKLFKNKMPNQEHVIYSN